MSDAKEKAQENCEEPVYFVFYEVNNKTRELLEASIVKISIDKQKEYLLLKGYTSANAGVGIFMKEVDVPYLKWCRILRTKEEALIIFMKIFLGG